MGLGGGLPKVGAIATIEGMPGFRAAIREVNNGLRDAAHEAGNLERSSGGVTSALQSLGRVGLAGLATFAAAATAGIIASAGAVTALGINSAQIAISVEDAFAGVTKAVPGLTDGLGHVTQLGAEVKQQFRELALQKPIKLEDLIDTGRLAAQLGVPREALAQFTGVVADLATTSDLTREQAATSMAQIESIYAIAANHVTDNTSRMGSSIIALGNAFPGTESQIVDAAVRIAGAGRIVGLSQADILGIGNALTAVGVEAEAGGTAVQKVLLGINEAVISGGDKLDLIAKTAGVSSEAFAAAWRQNAGKAFSEFVIGLGKQGDNALNVLDKLDLKDQRLIRTFLSLSNAGELVPKAMQISNDAWEKNTALTEAANERYQTTEAQLTLVQNQFRDLGLTLGDALLPAFKDVLKAITPVTQALAEQMPSILETLKPVIASVGDDLVGFVKSLAENLPGAIQAAAEFLTGTLVPAFNALPGILSDIGTFLTTVVIPAFNNLPGALGTINGFIQPLVTGFGQLWTAIGPVVTQIAAWLGQNIQLSDVLATLGIAIASVVIPAIADFIVAAAPVVALAAAIAAGIGFLRGIWESNFLNIQGVTEATFGAIKQIIAEDVWPVVQDIIKEWQGLMHDLGLDTVQGSEIIKVAFITLEAVFVTVAAIIVGLIKGIA